MSSYGSSRTSQQPDDSHAKGETSPVLSSAANVQETRQASQSAEQTPQEGHKRVYQACIPCRRRKVRCDLGSVDNPHDPPCVRCRRESKDCYFSATRRKRKTDDDDDDDNNISRGDGNDYVMRNGRRKLHADESSGLPISRVLYNEVPLTPAGVRSQPLRRPTPDARAMPSRKGMAAEPRSLPTADEPNTPLENLEARSVMRQELYGTHDALDLLYKAATDSPHGDLAEGGDQAAEPALGKGQSRGTPAVGRYDPVTGVYGASRFGQAGGRRTEQLLDPTLAQDRSTGQPGYAEAVQLWARFRFVRAGWFTAQEAIEYIDYYYKYLSPLTPISPPTFNNPASHGTLLNEEPILAVTLLTVSSRYKVLSGPGATCRSHAIHEQLWTYLRGMIERVVWGQEAFGGGFCGSGADEAQTSSTAPWRGLRKGSLRTLGTIESLMMLTEWHPRGLHFPPAEVTDELLLPSQRTREFEAAEASANGGGIGGADARPVGVGGKRIDSWLEPAWRSDRMSWMLLSTAMGLAYELGVFDDIGEMLAAGAMTRPEYEEETYRLRANRIKRLILIYLTQLAGRLGWTSMVPESLRKKDPASSRRRPASSLEGQTPGTSLSSVSTAFNYIPDLELDDQIIHCWVGISNAMHAGNEKLFRSRKHTTDIIQSGSYIELLKDFQPLLRDWWTEFERFRLPTFIRHILTIEYEYVRIYVNSLSLQAVVERCTNKSAGSGSMTSALAGGGSALNISNAALQLSPQTQNYYGKLPLGQLGGFGAADQEYVKEVVDGCRNLLRTVVDGLLPGGYLKHAPVRTYFRIISGAMFLLKTFALGAPKADVEVSIALMDRTVDALRNCVVDDVHLGTRFADLLESLTSRLRNRFIHAPASMSAPSVDSRSPNPQHYDVGSPAVASHHGHGGPHGSSTLLSAVTAGDLAWPKTNLSMDRCSTPANISATPFDPAGGSFPYASGMASTLGPLTPAASAAVDTALGEHLFVDGADWNNDEMWYLPAGPAFFQNMGESNVTMTAEGVSIAGIDLLDFMTMDQPTDPTPAMSGNGF